MVKTKHLRLTRQQEKARELIARFYKADEVERPTGLMEMALAQECALICIEEMILSIEFLVIDNMENESIMKLLNNLDKIQTEILNLRKD